MRVVGTDIYGLDDNDDNDDNNDNDDNDGIGCQGHHRMTT